MLPFKISVLIFVRNSEGELLLIERNKDPNRGCWRITVQGIAVGSRSWQRRGYAAAIRELLNLAWWAHETLTGEPCPHQDAIEALVDEGE